MRGKKYFSCDLLSLDYFTIALRKKIFSGFRNNIKAFPHTYKQIKLWKNRGEGKNALIFKVSSVHFYQCVDTDGALSVMVTGCIPQFSRPFFIGNVFFQPMQSAWDFAPITYSMNTEQCLLVHFVRSISHWFYLPSRATYEVIDILSQWLQSVGCLGRTVRGSIPASYYTSRI